MKRLSGNLWCFLCALLLSAASARSQAINSFSPLFASPGEIVILQGSGFIGVSAVQFANGQSASFTVTADTQISATVPSGAVSGPISILKSGSLVFSVQSFTAIGPGPYVDSFTPTTGNQGVQVTFTGVHFTGVTSVSFNGAAGTSVSVTADSQLRATVPAGATSGAITVTSPAGSWTTGTPFYLPPSVTSFSPSSGTPGTSVTINGANFLNASAVRFNGVSAAYTVNTVTRITATVPAGASSGTISVTAPAGGGSSATSFNVLVPPTITTQPASQTVAVGAGVTFTVSASSATAYQWRFNGGNISGATGSSFSKSNLQLTDSGNYDVVVSNAAGSVTSSTASLTVAVPPAITSQPQNRTVNPGVSATFSASASGSSLSYQWRRNGGDISGANSSSYTLASPQAADSGSTFSVFVNNAVGSATSSSATLTVNSPPSILSQPSGNTIFTGQNVTFSVSASGSTPFTYQWQKNSANISGATASSYSINNAQTTHAGSYRVVVGNSFGSITSAAATLTVDNPVAPSFTTQPQNQTVNIGQTATFSAAATGSPSPSYQWRKNGANISGATASSYTVSNVQLTHAGTYDVVASNLGGNVPSSGATLTVNGPPVVTSQPASQTAVAGATITLSVTASGSSPLTYQWRRDGTNLTGATSASLVLNAAQPGDSGYYSVVVTNPNGTTTSTTATINVLPVGAAPNRVLTLDGSGDFVTIPSAPDLQSPDTFTLEAWIFPSAFGTNTSGQFLNKGDGQSVSSVRSYEVTWTPDRRIVIQVFLDTATWATIATPAEQDRWVHVAVTYDSGPGRLSLFTNGLLAASTTRDASGQVLLAGQRIRQTTLPLVFGRCPAVGNTDATGQMDEVRIWNRVRSPEEIAGAMFCRLAGNEPGLAGYWTFDDGTANDLTGHGHHGVLSGATTTLLLGAEPLHTTNQTPCITSQPQSLTVGIGQNASFAVTVVAGTNPGLFSYQWRKDGTNVIGATGAMLVLNSVGTNHAGSYTVVVSNAAASVTSAPPAVVTVNVAPPGSVVAWGYNAFGQTTVPAGLTGVVAITAGGYHTVALKSDGSVVAWGDNFLGQTTVPVAAQSSVMAIAAGGHHTVALKIGGSVVAWGDNPYGQTTVPVAAQSGVAAIAGGGVHTVALKIGGTLVAWGNNSFGQTTVPVAAQSGVVAIAAGYAHAVALTSNGTVVAWGSNSDGQLAVPVTALSGVVAIAAGYSHTVALKNDRTVVAWGANGQGQANVPAGLSGVKAIAAGANHTVALKTDGTLVAWGAGMSIFVGDPNYAQSVAPAGLAGVVAVAAGYSHTVALIGVTVTTAKMGDNLSLLWPNPGTTYRVESALSLSPPALWSNEAGSLQTNAGTISLTVPVSGSHKFFRLVRP